MLALIMAERDDNANRARALCAEAAGHLVWPEIISAGKRLYLFARPRADETRVSQRA